MRRDVQEWHFDRCECGHSKVFHIGIADGPSWCDEANLESGKLSCKCQRFTPLSTPVLDEFKKAWEEQIDRRVIQKEEPE